MKKKVKKKTFKKTTSNKRGGEVIDLQLPTAKKTIEDAFFRYATLIYAVPGIGKTTFLASFPNAIMFSCERVSKAIQCFDLNAEKGGVSSWEILVRGVDLLEQTDQFDTVCIDTIDAAYSLCLDYVCRMKGLRHPSDVEDYGKTWGAIKGEFADTMDRIWKTGRGIAFSSHSTEVNITSSSGEKYTRIQPSMSGQAYKYIKAKTDFVFYAEYMKDIHGKQRRVLMTTGDEIVDAKHAGELPDFIALEKNEGAEAVANLFGDAGGGIPVAELRASKETSKTGGAVIGKARAHEARKTVAKKKKKKTSRR